MFPIDLFGELVAVEYETEVFTGVILPDWKRSLVGKIVGLGPDASDVEIGDKVGFGAALGMEAVYDGKPTRILRCSDLDYAL